MRQARRMYDARELTVEQIGQVLGVSRTSIYRALGKQAVAAAPGAGEPAPQTSTDGQPVHDPDRPGDLASRQGADAGRRAGRRSPRSAE